jgi:hypothetical protein
VLGIVQNCVNGEHRRIINCISLGNNYFTRFWPYKPDSAGIDQYLTWHDYQLKDKAPAYFIHNVIDHLCPQWANENIDIWYPEEGKKDHILSKKHLYSNHPENK